MSLRILQKQNADVTSQNSAAFAFPGQKWGELARRVLLTQPLAQILMKLINKCVSQSNKCKTRHRLEAVPRILRIMMVIRNFFAIFSLARYVFVFVNRVWDKINSDVTLY